MNMYSINILSPKIIKVNATEEISSIGTCYNKRNNHTAVQNIVKFSILFLLTRSAVEFSF